MTDIWRPTKLNDTIVQKLKDAFKLWCSIKEACCYAEISTSTYHDWISKNKEFSDEIEISKKYLEYKSRAVIAGSLEAWDVKTAMWYLERKNKREFSSHQMGIPEESPVPEKFVIEYVKGKYENYDMNGNPQ